MRATYAWKSNRMHRKFYAISAAVSLAAALTGCTGQSEKKDSASAAKTEQTEDSAADGKNTPASKTDSESVTLTVWGAEEDAALMEQIIRSFEETYNGQADFEITYEVQGEAECKDALLADLEQGADVFAFADDQLNALAAAGAIEPIPDADTIRTEHLEKAVEAASIGGTMYAYPLTADNGYFLYYNKSFFSKEDIKSLDQILKIAADHNKLFAMDWSSGWYTYSFFGNTGLEVGLNEDGITNYCTWNGQDGEIKGVDAAQAMLDIAKSPGFRSMTDTEFLEGVQSGTVIAGVSGVWNAVAIEEAWAENAGAAKLPEYSCGGRQIQMASFSGCKLIGVNTYSAHAEWAAKLAAFLTNEENQQLRFEMRGQGPSNLNAAHSPQVQQSAAIAALLEQSEFSQLQRIGGKFWDPVSAFGLNMAAGNPSGEDLQHQLDQMAEAVSER